MALTMCRVGILFVLLNLGAVVAEDPPEQLDAKAPESGSLVSEAATEVSLDSLYAHSKNPEAPAEDSLESLDVHIKAPEAAAEDSLESLDVHPKDPEIVLGEGVAEDSLDSPGVTPGPDVDPESLADDSVSTDSLDQAHAYSNASQNLLTDMVNDVVQDAVNNLAFLAPEKGDTVPPFPVTFPGCNCEWNEPGYSCASDILAPDSLSGQPCCCCGLKCLRDHRCSNDQCLTLGFDQQKEIEEEERRIAELLNRSDFVFGNTQDNIPAFIVDLGRGSCTNQKIIKKCAELGLSPVVDHSSYANTANAHGAKGWTNMQPYHWSQMVGRERMRGNGFPIPEDFDQKSMGMCFLANHPSQWALAPTGTSHMWTSGGTIQPLRPGQYDYDGSTTPSKPVPLAQMNDCSSELGCWRTLCVKKDPCVNCASCGNPCGPCGRSNCPPPAPPPPPPCINGKTMSKKYSRKWPHCTNLHGCFGGKKVDERIKACLNNPECDGFSFTHASGDGAPASGGGCLKQNCVPERNGYGYNSHDYWAKEPCSGGGNAPAPAPAPAPAAPQCASAPPSSTHLLVSGAWPCVKTGAPCKKVQMTASNGISHKSGTGMENSHIGVTCCDKDGTGSRPGCKSGVNFDQAVSHCKSQGLDLCTAEQIKAGSGEATGCRFDHGLVWTCSTR
eukprot:gnl/MRDRNA2_/MRDRNA2_94451_c0_seq1.p1 gnl/MRDRNA2_/MRDRNA2_94451_c0~~gnl/MRDRNA2_/MRDRNA2_94451_c0_seq1.p1  ORF type:complete len:669 (+),score=101.30 gnl/MRDRNA2_/MRDRNA2_94451_c0_seq1:106-2112(+)